ncbi:hypothetical protein GCM10025879_10760 [Leuconostoc litchii]|nr:hypothetical protein GCM10025879_10760 [Leuconostoc litchii]
MLRTFYNINLYLKASIINMIYLGIIILFLLITFTMGISTACEGLLLLIVGYIVFRLMKNKRETRK